MITKNLNPSQLEAVLHNNGPLIVFAGAGTGKTKVIVHRIARLLFFDTVPYFILAVTFTNKAAAEIKMRVTNLVPEVKQNVWISTFHSFCTYFLRTEYQKINLNQNFLIYNSYDQKNVIKECLFELNIDENKFKPSTVADKINHAKNNLKTSHVMTIEAKNIGDIFSTTISDIYGLYQKKLSRANALDFGDLVMYTVFMLQEYPMLLEYYQEKYKYVIVDEYQDTNYAQYILIKLISERYKNICVVGDDDQSIYSWRGANISNILNFKNDYPKSKIIKLKQNYRSTPKILSTAYRVIRNNNSRIDKQLWTKNSDDGSVEILKSKNENDEASKIIDFILLNIRHAKYNFSDFAVFYRTNAQSRSFEDAFKRSKVPYIIIGAQKFYDHAEIRDIIAYLKFIHNPKDDIIFKKIVNTPKRGIGKMSIKMLEKIAIDKDISLLEAIPFINNLNKKDVVTSLNFFSQFIKTLLELKDSVCIKEITEKIVAYLGYLKEFKTENTFESQRKIENIKELISAIVDFEKYSSSKLLADYLTHVALMNDTDFIDESNGKVTLMTLHLAKGLEFNSVFICGLEEGLFPIKESILNPEALEEERRLMYVGMTRAKKYLYLCWSAERTIYGKTKRNIPSRFIIESELKNEDSSQYEVGTLVLHPTFGKGKITERIGTGDDLKLIILFENKQEKKILVKIARLKLL
ncbi:MAG: UvrD-helicase domain-containing protein [Endomicrobium sp.]|jgi:DNA helicase-2/ATP-dependent DNA helicase PcrA|nr:UvrD-helicase domain-containing protein [Endomicrobium sp.]